MSFPSEKVCIAIPVYKPYDILTIAEQRSLEQCFTVLAKYPVIFFGPVYLEFNPYIQLAKAYRVDARALRFPDGYFKSLAGYNRLLLSARFYRAFRRYEFVLVYQPDAWVFRDELEYWCNASLDYIGAPWFEGFERPVENPGIIGVGNGGFSLRKTGSYLKVLTSFKYVSTPAEIWRAVTRDTPWYVLPISLTRYVLNLTIRNNTHHWFNSFHGQEDSFWGIAVARNFDWFRVASIEQAASFSFEACPERLYELNHRKLPFGCHAWEKYNPGFWSQFIRL